MCSSGRVSINSGLERPSCTAREPDPKLRAAANSVNRNPAAKTTIESHTAVSRERWWDLGIATLVTALAAVHRIAFLYSNRDRAWPFSVFYEGDSETYFRWARAISQGQLYDSGVPFHPPGFAYLLAMIHSALGVAPDASVSDISHLAVKAILAGLSAIAVGLYYLLLRPYLGRAIALLASLLMLYHFGLYVIAVAPVAEGVYLSLLMLTLLLWSRALQHPLSAPGPTLSRAVQGAAGLALGVLCGLLALTRGESVLLIALLVGVGLLGCQRRRDLRGLAIWAMVAIGLMATLTPWTLHNRHNLLALNQRSALAEPLPTLVPVTLYGPLNLALANHVGADGTFSPDLIASLGQQGRLQLENPEHLQLLLHGEQRAWTYVRSHPGDYASLVLNKWSLALESMRYGWTQWDFPGGLAGIRHPVDMMAPSSSLATWITAPLIILGLTLAWRLGGAPRRWLWIVLLVTSANMITIALFFGYVRQGLLLIPFWFSGVAIGIACLPRWLRGKRVTTLPDGTGRPGIIAVAVLISAVLMLELNGARADRNYEASGTNLPGRNVLNRDLPINLKPLP